MQYEQPTHLAPDPVHDCWIYLPMWWNLPAIGNTTSSTLRDGAYDKCGSYYIQRGFSICDLCRTKTAAATPCLYTSKYKTVKFQEKKIATCTKCVRIGRNTEPRESELTSIGVESVTGKLCWYRGSVISVNPKENLINLSNASEQNNYS